MGKLTYAANPSLDGFLEDETGSCDWSVPDEEMHAFWNAHERRIGTSLYGRGMYQTMSAWDSDEWLTDEPEVVSKYARIWRDTDKIVCFSSLNEAEGAHEDRADVRARGVGTAQGDLRPDMSIGGAGSAAEAFRHGLVDECVLLLCPFIVGGGNPALPRGARPNLELLDQRRFANGVIYLRYGLRNPA